MNYNILTPFAVPIIRIRFKKHENYIFNDIERCENIPDGWSCSINSSFPKISNNDSFLSSEVRDSLMSDLKESIQEVFVDLKIPEKFYFDDFWYNIYHEDQGQEEHNHLPMAGGKLPYWSGIYYNKNSSPTNFVRPDRNYETQLFKGYQTSLISHFYYSSFYPNVEDGDIILFPPYLSHYVDEDENRKNNMRVTFAFNMVPEN